MPEPRLNEKPRLLRAQIARGLETGATIDQHGGDQGAGIIRGMAIITRGEALGHYLWIDRVMLAQVAHAINASDAGVKARFTHPDLSGDGLGKYTGRVKDARLDGDVVRADLHFAKTAHETPDGDLAGYLMQLAQEDPEAFGNSIAFEEDPAAEREFSRANVDDEGGFKSPDPDNVKNLDHARLGELRAVDAVDEPAANPSGLFHKGQTVAADAEKLLSYFLGLSRERPALTAFDVDPDRAAAFVQRFLARNGLTLHSKDDKPMPNKYAEGLAKQLAADKEDKKSETDKVAQEQGDADKDEGNDKGKDESAGAEKKMAGADCPEKKMAVGGDAPSGSEAQQQAEYEDEEKKKNEKGKADAQQGTPVASPGSDKSAIGPMGDASNNVGYSQAQARDELKQYLSAFGPVGAQWWSEGKSFAEAQALHAKAQGSEIEKLRKENEELRGKAASRRGLEKPLGIHQPEDHLRQNTGGNGMSKFAAGLVPQVASLN